MSPSTERNNEKMSRRKQEEAHGNRGDVAFCWQGPEGVPIKVGWKKKDGREGAVITLFSQMLMRRAAKSEGLLLCK